MAAQVTLIPIDQIDPNPWQTRAAEDPQHIDMLAISIAEHGLRDEPMARYISETRRYQLAYGHSRLAAFRLLDSTGDYNGQFGTMPVKLAEISDQEMFELAVRENAERKDLNPIEEARAMRRYRDEFGKTSGQVGALFGLAESTVRNKMRLVDLPEAVQVRVARRDLSEVTARSLLTVQKVAPQAVENLAEEMVGHDLTPEVISQKIRLKLRDEAITLHIDGHGEEPAGGSGLWPLAWKPGVMMTVTENKFCAAFPDYKIGPGNILANRENLVRGLKQVWLALEAGEIDWELIGLAYNLKTDFVEKAAQLIRPPACTACNFYARMDGRHYCGLKACWERKKRLWIETQLAQKSEKMGIPIYDATEDGPDFEEPSDWADTPEWAQWLREGADHLRLRENYREFRMHRLTQSHCVQVISVRAEIREAAERERQHQAELEASGQTPEQLYRLGQQRRELALAFLQNQAAPVFGQAFEGLPAGVLEALLRCVMGNYRMDQEEIPDDPPARLEYQKQLLAYEVVEDRIGWSDPNKGALYVAGLLAETAAAWAVELPAAWMEMAAAYEVVSAETGSASAEHGSSASAPELRAEMLNDVLMEVGDGDSGQ